jgi:hypothetical protein
MSIKRYDIGPERTSDDWGDPACRRSFDAAASCRCDHRDASVDRRGRAR